MTVDILSARDDLNAVISAYNENRREDCPALMQTWFERHIGPVSTDPALHYFAVGAIDTALLIKRHDLAAAISGALYDSAVDHRVRQSTNSIIALANAHDGQGLSDALTEHVRTFWQDGRFMPGSFDILKVVRHNALMISRFDLLVVLDQQYFRHRVLSPMLPFPHGEVMLRIPGLPPVRLYAEGDCGLCRDIDLAGVFEPASLEVWSALARDVDLAIDVGANVGIYSLVAAAANPAIRIHAFEPNPEVVPRLRHNIALNGNPKISVSDVALSNSTGEACFRFMSQAASGSLCRIGSLDEDRDGMHEIQVATERLDTMQPPRDGARLMIKIDTEGGEGRALEGMGEWIERSHVDLIVESYEADICAAMTERLAPHGYDFYRIEEGPHQLHKLAAFMPASNNYMHNFNVLATRRPADELTRLLPMHCRIV